MKTSLRESAGAPAGVNTFGRVLGSSCSGLRVPDVLDKCMFSFFDGPGRLEPVSNCLVKLFINVLGSIHTWNLVDERLELQR